MIVPTFNAFLSGERVTAEKLNKNIREAGEFFLRPPLGWATLSDETVDLSNGSWFNIPFDFEHIDNDNMFSTPGYLTVRTTGYYHVEAGARFIGRTNGNRGLRVRSNGVDVDEIYSPASSQITADMSMRLSTVHRFFVNDRITADVYMVGASGTTSLYVDSTKPYYNFLRARWVAA